MWSHNRWRLGYVLTKYDTGKTPRTWAAQSAATLPRMSTWNLVKDKVAYWKIYSAAAYSVKFKGKKKLCLKKRLDPVGGRISPVKEDKKGQREWWETCTCIIHFMILNVVYTIIHVKQSVPIQQYGGRECCLLCSKEPWTNYLCGRLQQGKKRKMQDVGGKWHNKIHFT